MLNKICIYNSKIFLTLDTYLIAYSYKKGFEPASEKFKECFKIKIPTKCMYVKSITLKVIDNYATGLKSLLILIFDLNGLCNAFIYCDSFKKKFSEVKLPNWSITIEDYWTNLFICDGPTFLLHSNNEFHFFSMPYDINNSFDTQFICSGLEKYKILQFKYFGRFTRDNSQRYLFLLIISCNFSNQKCIKVVGFVLDPKSHALNCERIPLHFFFPHCYETELKSIQVLKVLPFFKTKSASFNDGEWKENMSLICTKDDCLLFLNAVLKFCCRLTLPLSEVMCIETVFSMYSSERMNLVLTFENKVVFFIGMKKNNTCEVVKYWTNIEAAISGDILKKGSKQVLLLKHTDFGSWENSCILYDLLSFMPIDLLSHSTMPDECLKTTISGLQRKVQVGKSVLEEVEQEISQKSAATIDALIKLNEFRVNYECQKHSYIFQETLVDLILFKDENKTEDIVPESELSVKLLDEKQRFIDNHWCISLFFENEGERSISYPSMKILMKGSQVTCMQKLFVHRMSHFSICDKHSWQINPKGKFTIVLSFEFTVLDTEDLFLILTWYVGSTDEFDNEIFINEEKKVLIQHQLCLQTKIRLSDIINLQVKTDVSSSSDLLFTVASQQRIRLYISSLHSNLHRLEDMLIDSDLKSVDVHLSESSSMKCIAFNNEKSLLFGIHIVLQNSQQNMIEMEVFTRNEREILLLIQYLYQHLPVDVIISPCLNSKDELSQMKKDAANAMKNEIDLLISSLSIHNISEEMRKNHSILMSSQTVGMITIPKATYQRIRTALVKREYITDSIFKKFS